MSFSIQRETSDGTLSTLDLTIEYIDRTDVRAYVNDIEIDLTGGTTPYTWEWVTDSQIEITPDVPNGLVAMVKRSTPMDAMYHIYDAGAVFKDETVDENFKQVLFLSQEAKEGSGVSDIYSNVNMHGYVIGNHGAAVLDGDLVTFGQYRNDALGAMANRVLAEAARDVAGAAKNTAVASAAAAALSETNAAASELSAGNSASSANTNRVLAEQAAVAAAGSLDEFTDIYLGPKAIDPITDNDGDPLLTGALYWNTSANEMRSYTGGIWVVAYNVGGVSTFNSRTGTVLPVTGDYSADMVDYEGGSVADVLDTVVTDIEAGDGILVSRLGSVVTVEAAGAMPLLFPLWCPERTAIPAGYVAADGQTLSRATYPDAWAGISAGNVPTVADATWISTTTERGKYTAGDGSSTFRLPDYNGKSSGSYGAVYLTGDGLKTAGEAGLIRQDEMQRITGSGVQRPLNASPPIRESAVGALLGTGDSAPGAASNGAVSGTATNFTFIFDSANSPDARTNTYTHGTDVSGCWVIKLFGAVVNVGSADAAQLASDYANLSSRVDNREGQLGWGQTWQDVTASRSANTTYTNTTGKPIQVSVQNTSPTSNYAITLSVSGVTVAAVNSYRENTGRHATVTAIVPVGAAYTVTLSNSDIGTWAELR